MKYLKYKIIQLDFQTEPHWGRFVGFLDFLWNSLQFVGPAERLMSGGVFGRSGARRGPSGSRGQIHEHMEERRDVAVYSVVDGKPVERLEDGCDVLMHPHQDPGRTVL